VTSQELSGPRRSIRLPGFPYAHEGAYFVTICSFQKRCLFGSVGLGKVELSHLGRTVEECWQAIPEHFPHAELSAHVVMPNHLHGILVLHSEKNPDKQQSENFQKPVIGSIPTLIRAFKAAVTRHGRRSGAGPEHPLWQRNYYECVLRDGKEFTDAMRYILENPARWEHDEENPARTETRHGLKL